jgi:hypothetical protein
MDQIIAGRRRAHPVCSAPGGTLGRQTPW